MSAIEIEIVKASLQKMMERGYFCITTVDSILKLTGGVPQARDYEALRLLHCVDFKEFSPTLREEFPSLLRRVLESPSMNLSIKYVAPSPVMARMEIVTR